MRTFIGIYQAIDPQHPLRAAVLSEAIALYDDATIMGYSIVHAINCKSTGTTSYGPAMNAEHVRLKADDAISGYFKSAIEPDGEQWTLHIYERPNVEAIHTSKHQTANEAMLTGRVLLQQLANRKTMRQLEVDQWFSFTPDSDGTWGECYKYMGNGWYGRAYSGGPWHKTDDTQVYILNDHLQALCNKQEQALIAEYLGPVVGS